MDKETQITEERKRFDNRGFAITAYARAYKLKNHSVLTQILNGDLDGSKSKLDGDVRRIMKQLKKDGVLRGKLSWEK